MFPGTKNRNEGTFGCSPVPRTGTKVHSDVPGTKNRNKSTFAKTALLRNRPFVSSRISNKPEIGQTKALAVGASSN